MVDGVVAVGHDRPARLDVALAGNVRRSAPPTGSYSRSVGARWTTLPRRSRWCWAVVGWCLVFAAPHFYWAAGGRAGLGSQTAAADTALGQPWFAAYNLTAGVLGILGAALALALARAWGTRRLRGWMLTVAVLASSVLVIRGLVGMALLATDVGRGAFDTQIPPVLLAIEPWFLLGGVAFALMVRERRGEVRSRPA
jgi:hypothetical protein